MPFKLAQALDAERRRISAELHDRTGPNLAAISLNLSTLELRLGAGGDPGNLLQETRQLLAETIDELREFSSELRPARLEYSGLVPALTERIERFRRRSGIDVQWRVRWNDEPAPSGEEAARAQEAATPRLVPEHEWLLYRIVQEALTNCIKHAAARNVRIELAEEPGGLSLTIEDDGAGFDPRRLAEAGVAGLGLLTMRERVADARGSFDLDSAPGQGTRIRVRLPLGARRS
jgi:two-component system sensor histidine kinase UhpB